MDMNYQQRAEYIAQCRRTIAAQDVAHRKMVLDHEREVQRITLESQMAVYRMLLASYAEAAKPLTKKKRITVAM